MKEAIAKWMMLAITVVVIVAIVWGSGVDRVEQGQEDLDTEINNELQVPSVSGTCTGC